MINYTHSWTNLSTLELLYCSAEFGSGSDRVNYHLMASVLWPVPKFKHASILYLLASLESIMWPSCHCHVTSTYSSTLAKMFPVSSTSMADSGVLNTCKTTSNTERQKWLPWQQILAHDYQQSSSIGNMDTLWNRENVSWLPNYFHLGNWNTAWDSVPLVCRGGRYWI